MDWPTKLPLIAILRGIRPDEALDHARALVDAGFDAIEIPLNSPDWALSVRRVAEAFGDRALIGGGTVLRNEDADALADAGGRLVVTPAARLVHLESPTNRWDRRRWRVSTSRTSSSTASTGWCPARTAR